MFAPYFRFVVAMFREKPKHPRNLFSPARERAKHPRNIHSPPRESFLQAAADIPAMGKPPNTLALDFPEKLTLNITYIMNAIHVRNLRNAEYLQYMKDFAGIINLNDPSKLNIDAKLSAFTAKSEELENLFKKALANNRTKVILALDERRDDAINGIYFFLQGYSYHFDKDKKQNAQKLLANTSLYGSGIARQNYQSETATLNNMLQDWEEETNLKDAISSFSLNAWVDELRDANTLFNTEYLSRTQEYGDANPETIKSKREEVNVAYYALRDRIDALHTLVETPESSYTTVINQLNALTDQYNTLLVNRQVDLPPDSPTSPVQ